MASIDCIRLPGSPQYDINESSAANTIDWKCSYCNSLNPEHLYRCENCYAPREECVYEEKSHV